MLNSLWNENPKLDSIYYTTVPAEMYFKEHTVRYSSKRSRRKRLMDFQTVLILMLITFILGLFMGASLARPRAETACSSNSFHSYTHCILTWIGQLEEKL